MPAVQSAITAMTAANMEPPLVATLASAKRDERSIIMLIIITRVDRVWNIPSAFVSTWSGIGACCSTRLH